MKYIILNEIGHAAWIHPDYDEYVVAPLNADGTFDTDDWYSVEHDRIDPADAKLNRRAERMLRGTVPNVTMGRWSNDA